MIIKTKIFTFPGSSESVWNFEKIIGFVKSDWFNSGFIENLLWLQNFKIIKHNFMRGYPLIIYLLNKNNEFIF